MGRKIIFIAVVLFLSGVGVSATFTAQATAQTEEIFNNSGLPIPRFISVRSNKVFVRTGPALRYPIKWVYKRAGMPVEVIQEFDTWRKIRDLDGEEGWIHQSLLSGKRYAVVIEDEKNEKEGAFFHKKPDSSSKKLAQIEYGNIIALEKCDISWCKAKIDGFSGWIERNLLWGVYQQEKLN